MRARAAFLVAVLAVPVQAMAQGITQWQGPNRDGIYNENGLLKQWPADGPKLLWHFDELGDGHASAAVTASTVYTAGMVGDVTLIATAPNAHSDCAALSGAGRSVPIETPRTAQ